MHWTLYCTVNVLDTTLHGQCTGYNIAWSTYWVQYCMVNALVICTGDMLHGQCTGNYVAEMQAGGMSVQGTASTDRMYR